MKISHLTLYSKNLERQKYFYSHVLGLAVANTSNDSVSFNIGGTYLTLEARLDATPYHYAINIPSNAGDDALEWLKARTDILTDQGREIQDFKAWNARSVYFYDAGQNIVEFIARRNLGYPQKTDFGSASLMEVSEVGLAVDDIAPFFRQLRETAGLTLFDGDLEHFSAIGDEYGLLICINRNKKTWYPTGDKAYPSEFDLVFTEKNKEYRLKYQEHRLKISRTDD